MSHLSKLKLSKTSPRQPLTLLDRKRRNLLQRLDMQFQAANAELQDEEFMQEVRKWVRGDDGEKQLVTSQRPVRKWWWTNQHGALMLSLRDGNRIIDLGDGETAIEVGSLQDLPKAIETVRAAIVDGELDKQLQAAAKPNRSTK